MTVLPLPDVIGHVAARRYPIPTRPQVLAPIPLPQSCYSLNGLCELFPFRYWTARDAPPKQVNVMNATGLNAAETSSVGLCNPERGNRHSCE